jgi:hypothetical protein
MLPPVEGNYFEIFPLVALGANNPVNPQLSVDDCIDTLDLGISDQTWSDLDVKALSSMLPSMNQGVSLVNFLLELKDFKYLFKRDAGPLLGRLKKFLGRLSGKDKNLPYREVSQLLLFKEFAVDPFLGDIVKIYKGLAEYRSNLRHLKRRANQVNIGRYVRTLSEYASPNDVEHQESPITYSGKDVSVWYRRQIDWTLQPIYHATCKYIYTLDGLDQGISELDALMDVLGVRSDPSIIWNAIPFSFIIDWFVNVSNALESFSVDNLGTTVKLIDFCSSVKNAVRVRQYAKGMERTFTPTTVTKLGEERLYVDVSGTFYERRTMLPNMRAVWETSGLSAREAVLSAALVGANVKRSNTKLPK